MLIVLVMCVVCERISVKCAMMLGMRMRCVVVRGRGRCVRTVMVKWIEEVRQSRSGGSVVGDAGSGLIFDSLLAHLSRV